MRKIKFRGWDKELNFMINIKRYKIDFDGQVLFDNNDKELYNQTNKIELMQYTGQKDKNNVDIYEGDIIKDKFGIIFGVVKYGKYKLSKFTKFDNQHHHIGFYVEKDSFSIQSLEEMYWYINESGNPIRTNNIQVVGNIYENPDLLKG